MSINHRRPLMAYIGVALLCAVVIAQGMMWATKSPLGSSLLEADGFFEGFHGAEVTEVMPEVTGEILQPAPEPPEGTTTEAQVPLLEAIGEVAESAVLEPTVVPARTFRPGPGPRGTTGTSPDRSGTPGSKAGGDPTSSGDKPGGRAAPDGQDGPGTPGGDPTPVRQPQQAAPPAHSNAGGNGNGHAGGRGHSNAGGNGNGHAGGPSRTGSKAGDHRRPGAHGRSVAGGAGKTRGQAKGHAKAHGRGHAKGAGKGHGKAMANGKRRGR